MKTIQLECTTREDYLAHLAEQIEKNHKVSRSGGRRGGNIVVAKSYGILPQALANVMNGYAKPNSKMLERDGLEEVRVLVPVKPKTPKK
ncbi:hypothetical protein U8C35_06375 [Sinorhizobium medicae]|uniref:hypothetical protein n=1 Tax=Sinorhizobium medicae TaxID=110321 RepID=UPI002AF6A408|nr:hypothetical protein [Sinorhizobium medicae]WQO60058.1 hypothetical protein U8C35_06375 [Sinorhizobium medicae]